MIGAQNNEWPSGTFGWNTSAAIQVHHAGSLNIVNCDLESVVGEEWLHPGNRLANTTGGALNIVDVTVESESSFHIGGDAHVTWRGNTDGGMNGFGSDPTKVPPYFDSTYTSNGTVACDFWIFAERLLVVTVALDATGGLLLSDQIFSRGAGYATEERTSFVSRSPPGFPTVDGDARSGNSMSFRVILDHVTLRDWSWIAVCEGPTDTVVCGYCKYTSSQIRLV